MDVDLLRPGTVPISKDTMLWFEFLLNPQLLDEHLANPNGDPTATDLIVKFLSQSTVDQARDSDQESIVNGNSSKPKLTLRARGLKVIALKVAAFLNWDLEILLNKLPLEYQGMLLKDLLSIVSEEYADPASHNSIDFSDVEPHLLFAIILYHRWVLKSYIDVTFNKKHAQPTEGATVPPLCTLSTAATSEDSAKLLWQILSILTVAPIAPSFSALVPLTEDVPDVSHRWTESNPITLDELRCQVYAELCDYWMVVQVYEKAKIAVTACKEAWLVGSHTFKRTENPYCRVELPYLQGLCVALGIDPPPPQPKGPSITIQFINSLASLDLWRLLDLDNIKRNVPITLRDCYELDAMSEVASGRATAHRNCVGAIKASNMVRRSMASCHWHGITNISSQLINKAMHSVLRDRSCGPEERAHLASALEEALASMAGTPAGKDLSSLSITSELLTSAQIDDLIADRPISPFLQFIDLATVFIIPRNVKSRKAGLERQLIDCIEMSWELMEDISPFYYDIPLDVFLQAVNKNWELPEPYLTLLTSFSGMKHLTISLSYLGVMLCKIFELDKMKDFDLARALIHEAMSLSDKFIRNPDLINLLMCEIHLLNIHQFHNEWPSKHMDVLKLSEKCTRVIEVTEDLDIRPSVRDDCYLALLNMGQWHRLASVPQTLQSHHSLTSAAQFFSLVAAACLQMKCNRKPFNDLLDRVLQVLATGKGSRGAAIMTSWMCSILDATALAVIGSLLSRIFNIICDQTLSELSTQLVHLWPSTIKDTQNYNTKLLTEMLWEVVNHAVKIYPANMVWSKLLGDLNFVGGHYSEALKCYLEAAIVGSDYFSRPVTSTILEDHVVKNMVRSCINLQCHAQGAILCQLLEDVDYTTAFKALQEISSWDAMDSYYDCIWDVTLLEFLINLHTRRNEVYRKQKAILMMSLLELNSNNNDEIKREAENIRKARFLRALVKQYVC